MLFHSKLGNLGITSTHFIGKIMKQEILKVLLGRNRFFRNKVLFLSDQEMHLDNIFENLPQLLLWRITSG